MLKFKPPVVLQLQEGQLIRCDQPARTATVRVLSGRVWVTRAADPGDHFLRPGCTLDIAPGSSALLSAETDAQVAFEVSPSWSDGLVAQAAHRIARLRRGSSGRPAGIAPSPTPG